MFDYIHETVLPSVIEIPPPGVVPPYLWTLKPAMQYTTSIAKMN